MTIQFSKEEVEKIRSYFNRIESGETQKQLQELQEEFPEWNTLFLLLRKLLAYAIYNDVQAHQGISYKELQTKSQKSDHMLTAVHTYFDNFDYLLATYTAHHQYER